MRAIVHWVLVLAGVSACHLASTIDPPKCEPGTHVDTGRCVQDPLEGPVVTLAGCASTPASIEVRPDKEFRFKNEDAVDRTISGDDGQVWVTARAGEASPFLSIAKVGTWRYHVSGCASGGAVVVK